MTTKTKGLIIESLVIVSIIVTIAQFSHMASKSIIEDSASLIMYLFSISPNILIGMAGLFLLVKRVRVVNEKALFLTALIVLPLSMILYSTSDPWMVLVGPVILFIVLIITYLVCLPA